MDGKEVSLLKQRQRATRKAAAIFLAPVIILLIVFIFYPILDTFNTSLYKWNGISSSKSFIGLGNWSTLVKDGSFWIAFRNNIEIMILSIEIGRAHV